MATFLGVVAATEQLLGTVSNALLLALEIRRELLNGRRRIQAHIDCLDSTISVLRSVQHESDSCSFHTEIHRFVQAVNNKVQDLYRTLQKHLQSISGGSFRKFVGALNTSKSEEKINGAFAALDREKTNLHLFVISIEVREKLGLLMPGQTMAQNNSGRCNDYDDVEMSNVPVDLADYNGWLVKNTAHQGNGTATAEPIPSDQVAPYHPHGIPENARVSRCERHTQQTTTSSVSSCSFIAPDPAREQTTHLSGHKIKSKSKYKHGAKVQFGDKVVGTQPSTLSRPMDVEMEDRYGNNANVHVGHDIRSNGENGSR
ncbi:hypothetical protein DV736_g4910, partial [Chaetothyriales sp. CBS 134916]